MTLWDFLFERFLVLIIAFIRTSGLMISAPLLSAREVPMQVRALLAFALAVLVAPVIPSEELPVVKDLIALFLLVAGELAVGFLLGLGLMLLVQGLQFAGELIAQTAGLSMGDVYDPMSDSEVSGFARLLFVLGLAVFLLTGGARGMVGGLLESFQAVKPGELFTVENAPTTVVESISMSYVLALRVAAPAVAALLTVTLVLGLIGRTLPQLNLLMLGFGLNGLVAMGMLLVTAGFVVLVLEQDLMTGFERLFPWGLGLP